MSKDMIKLRELVRTFSLSDGVNKTPLSYLTFYRSGDRNIDMPQTNNFYIYIVLDGSLRLYTQSGIMDYVPGQFFVSKIDIPVSGCVLTYSDKMDFLSLTIEFTLNDLLSVLLEIDGDLAEQIADNAISPETMSSSDSNAISSVLRLISVLNEPVQSDFIGRQLKREIIFYILCGSLGRQMLQTVANIQQADGIYEINSWIKENFRDSFTVEDLAEKLNMSVSLFHKKFKSSVGMGPIQCQKRLRLTEARRLMIDENKNVTEASIDVGYESVSQFIRDYKKMFGAAPKEDTASLREVLKKQANFMQKQASKNT